MKKVILAFSGGLDTSFCTLHLKEKGYDVVTATINTGGFDDEKLKEIEKKAYSLGSIKHYSINAEEKIYDQIIQYLIKLNGLYEGDYPLMCADRYVIAQEILEIAEKESTDIVAHGSTAIGNDQVRFDSAFMTLKKDITILSPIKELDISRDEEVEYIISKGFKVENSSKKYSINENVFGVTVSGSEIDNNKEPGSEAYKLTKIISENENSYEYLAIDFENGIPVKLNKELMSGLMIIKDLNLTLGKYGYGNDIYTGDCIIGIKGHIMFEAPGLLALIHAHKKLEQYTLTKKQLMLNSYISSVWSDLVYSGLYYEPLLKNIEAYADSVQAKVNGSVKIKVEKNKISVVEIESNDSLINPKVATYAQKGSWSAEEADGFIKLHSMQQKLAGVK
ncbi:MAG: argininosuccinate synthase [Candidatus Woesearchaeota archaeon]